MFHCHLQDNLQGSDSSGSGSKPPENSGKRRSVSMQRTVPWEDMEKGAKSPTMETDEEARREGDSCDGDNNSGRRSSDQDMGNNSEEDSEGETEEDSNA